MSDLLPAARDGSALPDTLHGLAAVARAEHAAFERDARSAVMHAIRCGEALTAAKAKVGHGEWLPWLGANFPGRERTAQNYMRLAANPQRVAHLGTVRGALAELSEPRDVDDATAEHDRKERARKAATDRCLSECQHLTRAQWDEFAAQCGALWVMELVLVTLYASVRDANDQQLPDGAYDAVADIAMRGADDLRDWARDVANGEKRPPGPPSRVVTADELRAVLHEHNTAEWAMGDWVNAIGDDAFRELVGVMEARSAIK